MVSSMNSSGFFDDYVEFDATYNHRSTVNAETTQDTTQDNDDRNPFPGSYYPDLPSMIGDTMSQPLNLWGQQQLTGQDAAYPDVGGQSDPIEGEGGGEGGAGSGYGATSLDTDTMMHHHTTTFDRMSSTASSRQASSKTSRSSQSSKSSAPPTEWAPPQSSTSKARKGRQPVKDKGKQPATRTGRASSSTAGTSSSAAVDQKRDKFLERNRIAASKCRQKKKEWVHELEETKDDLESRNSHLQMEFNGLLDQVSVMKTQIMTHAACNDPNIDKWIENEARRFVQTTSERYDREQRGYQMPASAGHGSFSGSLPGVPSYASSYQADDASQVSPTDMSFSPDGSLYMEPPVEGFTGHSSHRRNSSVIQR